MRWALVVVVASCAVWGFAAQPGQVAPTGPYFPARYTKCDEWGRGLDLKYEAKLLETLDEPSIFASATPTIRFFRFREIPRKGVCLRLTRTELVRKTYGENLATEETSHPVGPDTFARALELVNKSSFQDGKSFLVGGINCHGGLCLVEVRDEHGYRVGVGNVYPENGMEQLSTFLDGR